MLATVPPPPPPALHTPLSSLVQVAQSASYSPPHPHPQPYTLLCLVWCRWHRVLATVPPPPPPALHTPLSSLVQVAQSASCCHTSRNVPSGRGFPRQNPITKVGSQEKFRLKAGECCMIITFSDSDRIPEHTPPRIRRNLERRINRRNI